MDVQPLFSIILPTFNSEKTIDAAMASILRQTFSDFELIIIDGRSGDDTLAVIEKYQDNRIRLSSEPDSGVYDAMNKGVLKSRGQWIFFLGSDDKFFDDQVLKDIAKQIQPADDIIYGNVMSEPLNGRYDGLFTMEKLFNRNICHQSIFIKKTLFKKTGLFDLKYKMQADWDHNIKWFMDGSIHKHYTERIIADYAGTGLSAQVRDQPFEKDKTGKFLAFPWKEFSPLLKQHLNLAQAIQCKEDRDYAGFLKYKFRFWISKLL